MTDAEIVYNFQHRLLPEWFYTYKEKFIALLLHSGGGVLFRMLDDGYQKAGLPNPYSETDFCASTSRLEDGTLVIQIDFPEPKQEPLCRRSYLFFGSGFQNPAFFTVEKGGAANDFLCGWSEKGEHLDYGMIRPETEDEFTACVRVYRGK